MPQTWRAWTSKDLRRLAELRAEGRTLAEIGAALGRTASAVSKVIERKGRPAKRTRRQEWWEALQVIHTIKGVAARMGVPEATVRRTKCRLRSLGYSAGPARRPGGLPEGGG